MIDLKEFLHKWHVRLKNRRYVIEKLRNGKVVTDDELEDLGNMLYNLMYELELVVSALGDQDV